MKISLNFFMKEDFEIISKIKTQKKTFFNFGFCLQTEREKGKPFLN